MKSWIKKNFLLPWIQERKSTSRLSYLLSSFLGAGAILILSVSTTFATPDPKTDQGMFSAKGKITQVNAGERFLLVKLENGPELTFFVDEATQVRMGKETTSLARFATGDSVEMEYFYDQDYRKVLRTLRKD